MTCTWCERPTRYKGLCGLHYQRKRAGIPMDAPVRGLKHAVEDLAEYVELGGTVEDFASRTGVRVDSLMRRLYREGRRDLARECNRILWRERVAS